MLQFEDEVRLKMLDMASFMVKQVKDDAYLHQAPVIGN